MYSLSNEIQLFQVLLSYVIMIVHVKHLLSYIFVSAVLYPYYIG